MALSMANIMEKRMTVICNFYKWGNHEKVTGPDACNLQVGNMIIPNRFPPEGKRQDFVDVAELGGDVLAVATGAPFGDDRVEQQFRILKYEVLSENPK